MARHDRSVITAQDQASAVAMGPREIGGGHRALTFAIASALGLTAAPVAAQTVITVDTNPLSRTATTVTTSGATTKVTTATQSGANAFNSFSVFRVGSGDTVNLHLPTGASNLINLVWDEQVSINGLLNSYKGNNGTQIGGRVFFAAPNGFVVGSTGVLNVGALSIATPRADEMLLLGSEIGTGGAATERLLKGQLATADASVDVAGRINALDDVRIQARAIDVSGTIFVEGGTGADRLDSQVAVNTGAPAGTRLVQDGDTILLVAQDAVLGGDAAVNLKAGSVLRANGGDVIVQSDTAITTDGLINTRATAAGLLNPGAANASTGDSGNVTLAGRTLDVGGIVDASATGARAAGDVVVEARARDGVPFGRAQAESSATVRGTLNGRDIRVTAQSTASSDWEFDPNKPEELPEIGVEQLSNAAGTLGVIDVGYLHGTSKATVTITGTANLQATRDVQAEARTITSVQTKASTKGNGLNNDLVVAGIGAAYGELDANATVTVASGAHIAAGNDVSVKAATENTLTVGALTLTTGTQPIAATVAISDAQIDAQAEVAKGAVITARDVSVTAHNESDFKTTAKATSDQDGQVGLAGAISLQNVNATATNGADLSGIRTLTVDATSHTGANITGSKVAVGKSGMRILMEQKKADAQLAIFDRMTKGYGSRSGLIGQQSQGSGENKSVRLGSAMSYVDATHTANATIADNTAINATGAVTVSAKVEDEGISQVAGAGVASKAKDQNGADTSISAAMNYGQYRHEANARVGRNASITADTIGVLGTVHLPLGISRSDLDDIGTFFSTIDDVLLGEQDELTPLDLSKPITSMVSAKAKGEKLGLGGAVNYIETNNRSTAWVDDGAVLDARTVEVKALTDIVALHVAGKPSPTGSDKGSAVGGTFNDVIYGNTTLAGIGAGAVVTADESVAVDAQSRNITYIIAPTAGTAQDEAIAGMVSIADTSDVTHASISNDARIDSASVDVGALQDDLLVSAAGALGKGAEAGIGLSVAVNNRSTDTRAFIGDNSKDATGATGVEHVAPATVDGYLSTDALDVTAQTKGMSVALSIAGGVAKNEDPNKPKGEPGFLDKLKKSVTDKQKSLTDKATNAFTQVPGLNQLFGKAGGAKPLAAPLASGSQAMLANAPSMSTGLPPMQADDGAVAPPMSRPLPAMSADATTSAPLAAGAQAAAADKPQPKFGLSISGSASVNMAHQVTIASIDGATVKARTPAGTQSTTVQALNSAELASASGSAAITRAKAPGGKFNAALAGAVAYGLIDNSTRATVGDSTLHDVDDLAVRALNVGEHTAIGISVGAEVSGGSTTSASFSGSFSVAQIDNDTRAALDDSIVTGASVAGTGVDITAYDRSRIGIGGGSLYVNTSTGSNANLGAAFTYAETNGSTTAAIGGGSVTGIDALSLRAIDSALIGSAAAMGGGGKEANGLAGAVVWNAIGNTTRATIDDGAVVRVDGDIAVSARASAPVGALDALVAGGIHDGSGYDFSGSELYANSSSTVPSGTSIISVAGLVQAGKNNIGLSFVGSNVSNTHEVSIGAATLDAGSHRIDLDATDNTSIISATVGVGVASGDFAGLGSATANMIGNTSRVRLSGASVTAGVLDAQARDDSAIYSLAGNVTVSKNTAAGAAVSYNRLGNTVESLSTDSVLNVGTLDVGAQSHGDVLAGAVAGAVSKDIAIGGSFGWTESGNSVAAAVDGGSVTGSAVTIHAVNDTALRTLSGSVGVGKQAGIGAAFNTVLIQDDTTARLDGTRLAATGDVVVKAEGTGEAQSLAVAGAASQGVAVSGSDSNSIVNNDVSATAQNLRGAAGGSSAATARTLRVEADSTMDVDSLAGAVAGAQSAAVGGAVGVNVVGGSTTATLAESVLGVTQSVDVRAASQATVDTLAVAGSGAAQGAFAGAMTTNFVTSAVQATVRDTGSANTTHTLTVAADDASRIESLAGAAGVAGNAGIGASIAVNRIATDVGATIEGGDDARQYKAGEVVVSATGRSPSSGTGANIRTVAIGVGGGGDVGGAGSLAINLLDNDVRAGITDGADVLSSNNVAVTADNRQGIDVLAGSAAFGGTTAGVGIGLVVNDIRGETIASITGATTQVSALALGAGRTVNDNALADPSATDISDIAAIGDYTAPDLAVGSRTVNGIAVNALSRQHVGSAAAGLALSFNPTGSIAVAAVAGTNVTGGTTRATIDGARINQATGAASDQAVDVRAGSHAVSANFIAGVAGGASTAAATGAVASNVFSKETEASIVGATTRAAGGVTVDAEAVHNSVALSVGLAGALVGGAGSASINVFDTRNRAFVAGGSLAAASLSVDADTVNRVNLISGAGAAGGVGVAGSFLVNVGSSDTEAYVGDDSASTRVNVSGTLGIDASSTSIMKGVAVSGAAGGAAGVAGMAGVSVIANSTRASLRNAQASAGGVDVGAHETVDLSSYAGALGLSSSGYGVGAAANVAVLSSTTSAGIADSTVTTTGTVTVDADSKRTLDAVTVTAGVGGTAGIGGAASLLLVGLGDRGDTGSELDKDGNGTLSKVGALAGGDRVDGAVGDSLSDSERDAINARSAFDLGAALAGGVDGVFARVSASTIAAGSLNVDADSLIGMRNIAGAAGVGGVGVGGAIAYSGVYDTTAATIDTNSVVTTTGGVSVTADSGDADVDRRAGDARAYAGGAGLVGLGAAIGITNVDRATTASAGGRLSGGSPAGLSVKAADTSTVRAEAVGAAAGAAAVGIVVSDAAKRSAVTAEIASTATKKANVSGFKGVDVDASSSGTVTAEGTGAAAGLAAAGTGVGVNARDASMVRARIGDGASVGAGSDGTTVTASATPQAKATALGATVGGSAGLGASVAIARADVDVAALVGNGVNFGGSGTLDVVARVLRAGDADSASAKSTAGTGGVLLGANASVAEATSAAKAVASTGDDVKLSTGAVNVHAALSTSQRADSAGVAVGALALGASVAKATSSTTTSASLGARNSAGSAIGDLLVKADATDRNRADSVAGAGGVVSGNASRADTASTSTTTAAIGAGTQLSAHRVEVAATHDSRFAGSADSVNASFVGASGAGIGHQANATVNAAVGSDAKLGTVDDIRIAAQNRFHSDGTGPSVNAAGGGVINGSAALVDIDLAGTTNASIGDRAQLATGLTSSANGRAGDIHLLASTVAETDNEATLSTGGAIDVAVVKVDLDAAFANHATIGANATLDTYGYINAGTYTQAMLDATALVNTWGLAAVGASDADVDVSSTQTLDVGANARLQALRNIYLTAGRDSRNLNDSRLDAGATSQGYVRGLIAVPASSASGHTRSDASTTIASGAQVISASNVTAGAYTGSQSQRVDGTGHGYQLGFIPVTQRDSDAGGAGSGTVTLNGALTAGRYNTLTINIDASGNLTQTDGLTVDRRYDATFNPRAFLDGLTGDCSGDGTDGCKALAALKGSVANSATGGWILGPMFAAGGDVFLHGDAISGSGSATAKGAPTISITNNSNRALVLDDITLPDYAGGNVRFTGTAGSAGGVSISQAPSTAKPTVTVRNLGTASNPGAPIFAMGDIRNIGGLVRLTNNEGSLGLFATVYAQQQIVEAPNGIVTFNNIYADWFSGSNPQSDWRNMLLRPANPDEAVLYIMNSQYGSGSAPLYRSYGQDYAGSSIVAWGGCLPHYDDSGCGGGPFGRQDFRYDGDGGDAGLDMPAYPARTLYREMGYGDNAAVASNAAGSSFIGQQIYVRAKYVDVNSTIDAGAGTNWSLKLKPEMQSWIDALGAGAQGLYDIPAGYVDLVDAGSRLIKARYDATNKRIVVDNVNASGGGYVYLDGRIVSSTPYGKVKVSSGYGKVSIDSAVNLPVQVSDINVGNGAVGVVEIVDRQKASVNGSPYTTWYVSRQGQATQAFDNRNGAPSYDTGFALANAASYAPTAGMRYQWTEQARVGRADRKGAWGWVDASGGRVDDGQQWTTTSSGFFLGTPGAAAFTSSVSGSFTSYSYDGITYGCNDGCNFGFPAPPSGLHWNPDRNGGKGGNETWWMYMSPLKGTVTLTGSVKADNPIAIDFSGNALGSIDVRAQGDLLVNGRISNSGGNTTLTTTANGVTPGNILRTGDTATVTTRNLIVHGNGSLGQANGLFEVTLTDNGTIDATSAGAYLRLLSGGALHIDSGLYGVVVDANGSITGNVGSYARDITGGNISLTSRFGSIGSIANPLDIDAREFSFFGWRFGGNVSASALGDIALTDHSGDFWIDRVVSETGNVRLEATAGALLDSRQRTAADVLDEDQVRAIWSTLKLDGSGVAGSVTAFENQVRTRYQDYWRLLGQGSVADGHFVLSTDATVLWRPLAEAAAGRTGLTDAEVGGYADRRYQDAVATFADAFGDDWRSGADFQARNAAFAYSVDPASQTYARLAQNSTWTEGQLKYAINANALEPASGAVGRADPNVRGRDVTLVASSNVGRLAADLDVDYASMVAGSLGSDAAVALALANAPGDVVLVGPGGKVYSRDELLALTPAQVAAGAVVSVRIRRTSPLFVEVAGKLNGSAGQAAYLQANDDLAIERFTTGGDARIAATGSLRNARTDASAALDIGGDLVLLAGNGSIGAAASGNTAARPLVVDVDKRLLSASAGQDVLLRQLNQDLRVGTVFAGGRIGLEARDGSIVSVLDGIALDGHDIDLVARDAIGHRDASATSGLTGALQLRVAGSGLLNGSAGTEARIASPDRDLRVGSFTTGGNLSLVATQGALSAATLAVGGDLQAAAGSALSLGSARVDGDAVITAVGDLAVATLDATKATLAAGGDAQLGTLRATGALTVDAAGAAAIADGGLLHGQSVSLDAASLATGALGGIDASDRIAIRTDGDMQLGALALTGDASGHQVVLEAGGRIDANGDGRLNVAGGRSTELRMQAGQGIGSAGTPLSIDIGRTTARSTLGDIHLDLPNGGRIDSLIADAGSIGLGSGGALDLGRMQAAQALHLHALGRVDAGDLVAGGDLALDAGDVVAVGSVDAGGGVAITGGASVAIASLTAAGTASLDAATSLGVGHASVGDALTANAGTTLTFDDARVGGGATLASGGAMRLGTLDAARDVTAAAGGTLEAQAIHAGGDARLDSGQGMHIAALDAEGQVGLRSDGVIEVDTVSGRGLAANAADRLSIAHARTTGDMALRSGAEVALGDATAGGGLDVDADGGLAAGTLSVDGDAMLHAGLDATVGQATVGGVMAATADGNAAFGNLDVGSDATLQAGGDLAVGTAVVGGDLATASGAASTLQRIDVSGDATVTAGTHLTLDEGRVGGSLSATAATGDLVAGTLDVGSDAMLAAGNDARLAAVTVGRDLAARAGHDLDAGTLAAGRGMDLAAGHDLRLADGHAGSDALIDAGHDLQAATLAAGHDVTLRAGGNAGLGQVSAGNDLHAVAMGALSLDAAYAGNDAALDAATLGIVRLDTGHDARLRADSLQLGNATVAGTLDAATTGVQRIDSARIGLDAILRSQGTMDLGDVGTGRDLDAVAAGTLRFAALDGGRDVLLTSTGGDVVGGSAHAGRDLRMSAAQGAVFDTLEAAGSVAVEAGAGITGASLSAGTDVLARAGGDIAAQRTMGGAAVTLDAGEALRLGEVAAGSDLSLAAGADVGFGTLRAGGGLGIVSRRGHVEGDRLNVGGSANVVAATDVMLGDATIAHDLDASAGRDLGIDRYAVGGRVSLVAAHDMRIGTGASGGKQSLLLGGNLGFGNLTSETGLTVDATGGRIDGGLLAAPVADLAARDGIALDIARIGSRLNMASAVIDAAVEHTGSGTLSTRLTGYRDGVARRIDLSVDARDGWLMERLAALQAELDTTASAVSIRDGFVGETMRLDTRDARLWMDNLGATLRIADVQFMELDKRFELFQTGVHTLTDAYVVRFSPGFQVEVPNYVASHDPGTLNYLGESALRYTVRTLSGAAGTDADGSDDTDDAGTVDVVRSDAPRAVNIGATP